MSDETKAARRYARAILELAVEASKADAVQRDLEEIVEVFVAGEGELMGAMSNPVFPAEERAKVLAVVLPRLGVDELTGKFMGLLSDRRRLALLPDILRIYSEMVDERAGRVRVSVSTVEPLSPQLEKELEAAFAQSTGKTVVLDARIDTSLIGGMVARIGGRVYDASIRSRLEDIKHRLINAQAAPEA